MIEVDQPVRVHEQEGYENYKRNRVSRNISNLSVLYSLDVHYCKLDREQAECAR